MVSQTEKRFEWIDGIKGKSSQTIEWSTKSFSRDVRVVQLAFQVDQKQIPDPQTKGQKFYT